MLLRRVTEHVKAQNWMTVARVLAFKLRKDFGRNANV